MADSIVGQAGGDEKFQAEASRFRLAKHGLRPAGANAG
jgi:hypothetical protein